MWRGGGGRTGGIERYGEEGGEWSIERCGGGGGRTGGIERYGGEDGEWSKERY